MNVATCTPVDFEANAHFFGRDSGLMCRGIQANGHQCVVVMPGKATAADAADLVRVAYEDLESPEWWRSRQLNLVLLYAWGDPTYLKIAKAIRSAGILLAQNLDTAGLESPYADFARWWRVLRDLLPGPQPAMRKLRLIGRAARDLVPTIYERRRLAMLCEADFLAAVSPPAGQSVRDYVEGLGQPAIAKRIVTIPHPVTSEMEYRGEPKLNRVLCVGRWNLEDHHQKDPSMLLKVLAAFLQLKQDWSAEVVGRGASRLAMPENPATDEVRRRITFTEQLDHASLRGHYAASNILLCPSRFESFHISSAEALCCGCTIVVADHPLLSSTGWFTSRGSGTLAVSRSLEDLTDALITESGLWESGNRSPQRIASLWITELRCDHVAKKLIQLAFPFTNGTHDSTGCVPLRASPLLPIA